MHKQPLPLLQLLEERPVDNNKLHAALQVKLPKVHSKDRCGRTILQLALLNGDNCTLGELINAGILPTEADLIFLQSMYQFPVEDVRIDMIKAVLAGKCARDAILSFSNQSGFANKAEPTKL